MAKARFGKLKPRYKFILNQYPDQRLSKCPFCHKLTHARKFAFFVHVDGWGLMAMGKTARYCSPCELIILHQHELEEELADQFNRLDPKVVGNDYLVIGTVDKKIWRQGLEGGGTEFGEMLKHVADFKDVYNLEVKPAGWYRDDEE